MKKIASLTLFILIITACAPFSKEKYFEKYQKFLDEVSEQCDTYTAEQWDDANKKYARFNNEWYNKFKDDFTLEEKIEIAGFKIKYNLLKAGTEIESMYDMYLKEDVNKIKNQVEYYIENNMEDDLNKILDEAKKSSKEFYEELSRIKEEVEKEIEK